MDNILELVDKLKSGKISLENFIKLYEENYILKHNDIHVDTFRNKRLGFDEVIYGRNKTVEQIKDIISLYEQKKLRFFCTGLDNQKLKELKLSFPNLIICEKSGTAKNFSSSKPRFSNSVGVIAAGTSDSKVAYEAIETLNALGIPNKKYIDIGVAGIHRFLHYMDDFKKHSVLIVIAGMEGALPSVVGGIFSQPIIAVPTSVGYGTALSGFTPLLAMLTSCANGITVVNIDNGFGAAMAAFRIIQQIENKNDR
ncbi:nickel pincer cofactor biosynthesis protein LarB [Deferribacter thermophilus]|uniref:nickel pincer cofactor biosynthesis protein LarB n=1 Tax=Deferribacter thermophilus TaxID=53573 RepID=UPI003C1C14AA